MARTRLDQSRKSDGESEMTSEPSWTSLVAADYRAMFDTADTHLPRAVGRTLTSAGMIALVLMRAGHAMWTRGWRAPARIVTLVNHAITGADVAPDALAGPGLRMKHPQGVVIGRGARVGRGCVIMQQVTLGRSEERRVGKRGGARGAGGLDI